MHYVRLLSRTNAFGPIPVEIVFISLLYKFSNVFTTNKQNACGSKSPEQQTDIKNRNEHVCFVICLSIIICLVIYMFQVLVNIFVYI